MQNYSRRQFIKYLGGASALTVAGISSAISVEKKSIVVIGGGAAGCIAAKYIKQINPAIDVTLIEKNKST